MKIMVALDLSDYADFVLIKAIKTARQQNAKMDIVVVVEEGEETYSAEPEGSFEKRLRNATLVAQSYRKKAIRQGVKAKLRVRSGKSAAEEILKYQNSEKTDLLVVGRRSRTGRTTCPMGPVSQRVVSDATCTVMVVRCVEKRDKSFFNATHHKK